MNNLYQITKYIESICKSLPNTGDVYDGSIFQLNEQQNINYPAYVITNRQHLLDRDNETLTYNFAIFAVDRLTSDKENKLDVQSWAIQSLQYLAEKIEDVPALVQLGTIDCFEDRFDSLTAGAYLNLQFNVNAVDCGDNIIMPTGECILQPLRVTEDGIYTPQEGVDGFDVVNVNVQPKLTTLTCKGGSKRKEYIFDPEDDEGDGWNKVVLDMPMLTANITQNGTLEWKDVDQDAQGIFYGWDKIIVNIPEPVLNPIEIFQNGTYMPEEGADGYDKVVVNVPDPDLTAVQEEYNANGNYTIDVPDGYDGLSGVEVRVNVEPILQSLEVTENGEYFPDDDYDGYSSVFVDVKPNVAPQDITITDNGGYHYDAQAEGFDGYSIVDVTVNVQPNLTNEEVTYNENGSYIVQTPSGYDGIENVEVRVEVPSISTMEITQAEYDNLPEKDNNVIYLIKE